MKQQDKPEKISQFQVAQNQDPFAFDASLPSGASRQEVTVLFAIDGYGSLWTMTVKDGWRCVMEANSRDYPRQGIG